MPGKRRLTPGAGRMVCLGALILAVFIGSPAAGADLRGRIDGMHAYSNYPFPLGGVRVDVYAFTPSGPVPVRSAVTGGDGMYYLPGMAPGPYELVVNGRLRFPLQVHNVPYQDIPPILLR